MKHTFIKALLAAFLLHFSILSFAQSGIPILPEPTPPGGIGGRSIVDVPSVSLDGTVLTISFPSDTLSQVVIIDQRSSQTVYSDSFATTTQVVIDLDDEGIGEGSYLLRIYAFGKWWWGEFVLEEE